MSNVQNDVRLRVEEGKALVHLCLRERGGLVGIRRGAVEAEREYELTIWRSNLEVIRERSFASRAMWLESQARTMLPKNERGTAPAKTLWSNWRLHVTDRTR